MVDNKTNKWKVAAIIFIILFVLENALFIWAVMEVQEEEEKTNKCYYDICEDNLNAVYANNICECLDYDSNEGGYVVSKTATIY